MTQRSLRGRETPEALQPIVPSLYSKRYSLLSTGSGYGMKLLTKMGHYTHLICEDAAIYLVVMHTDLEAEEKHALMGRGAHQNHCTGHSTVGKKPQSQAWAGTWVKAFTVIFYSNKTLLKITKLPVIATFDDVAFKVAVMTCISLVTVSMSQSSTEYVHKQQVQK